MTTKTTKIVEAISILSEILLVEAAAENHPFDDSDEIEVAEGADVGLDVHEFLTDTSDDYQAEVADFLESIQTIVSDVLKDELDDEPDDVDEWSAVPPWVDIDINGPIGDMVPVINEEDDFAELKAKNHYLMRALNTINNLLTTAMEENNTFRDTLEEI